MKNRANVRIWLAGAVVAFSAAYLVISSLQASAFSEMAVRDVRTVDMATRVKVNGKVVPGSTRYEAESVRLEFRLVDEHGDEIAVVFNGVRPSAFRDDAQVMIEGYYDTAADLLNAETLLAKCPSRYEESTTGADPQGATAAPVL